MCTALGEAIQQYGNHGQTIFPKDVVEFVYHVLFSSIIRPISTWCHLESWQGSHRARGA